MRRSAPAALLFLIAYVACRAALGATLNPPYNGPDESGHVEYVRALAERPGTPVTGAEAHQPPAYYVLASVPWRLAPEPSALFWTRLLSAAAGTATLALTWRIAQRVWPERPVLALTAGIATLAPGHLFLLASVNNDPLAATLCSLTALAAVEIWLHDGRSPRWWATLVLASVAAVSVKLSAAPLILGTALALGWRWRRALWRRWWVRGGLALGVLAAAAINLALLQRGPTMGALAAAAHFWPHGLALGPVAYLGRGGLGETFRTWWYAYDYVTRWPLSLEIPLAAGAGALTLAALAGLLVRHRLPGETTGGTQVQVRTGAVLVLACAVVVQAVAVLARFGLGSYLQIEMGGAAQAKAFIFAVAPAAALFACGLTRCGTRLAIGERWTALGLFGWLIVLDAVSLAFTTWQHYRWWQAGA